MTVRNPLVLIPGGNPQIQELPSGDVIGGAAQGPVGMTFQGAWNSGTSYVVDDVVTINGSSYIAIAPSTNQSPPNATYWSLLNSIGTAATVAVGTVTTLSAGSSATVTNSGSSSAAVFNFGIPAGATGPTGGDMVLLSAVTTSGSQANVTFSSISSSYRDLQLRVRGRGTNATTGVTLQIQFNSDTGANYDQEEFHFVSTANAGTQGVASTQWNASGASDFTANSAPANAAASAIIDILDYRGTTFFKSCQSRVSFQLGTGASTQGIGMSGCTYRSTSAISAIKVFFSAGNFTDGSVVSLYGIN